MRRRAARRLLAAALALAAPRAARGYRPFDSTDAAVAPPGVLEIELGPGLIIDDAGRALVAPGAVVNVGIARSVEAVVEARHLLRLGAAPTPRSRIEDLALSVKGVLLRGALQDRPGPSIAVEASALLPSSRDDGAGAEATLIGSARTRAAALHVDAAAVWTRAHEPGAFAGVIVEGPDAWPVRPVAEVFAEAERGRAPTRSALAGAIWTARDGLALDGALRVARQGADRVVEVRLGVTLDVALGRGTGG